MIKTTIRELKEGLSLGIYKPYNGENIQSKTKIKYSTGIYGINGGLFQDDITGDLYVITRRNTYLARIF